MTATVAPIEQSRRRESPAGTPPTTSSHPRTWAARRQRLLSRERRVTDPSPVPTMSAVCFHDVLTGRIVEIRLPTGARVQVELLSPTPSHSIRWPSSFNQSLRAVLQRQKEKQQGKKASSSARTAVLQHNIDQALTVVPWPLVTCKTRRRAKTGGATHYRSRNPA